DTFRVAPPASFTVHDHSVIGPGVPQLSHNVHKLGGPSIAFRWRRHAIQPVDFIAHSRGPYAPTGPSARPRVEPRELAGNVIGRTESGRHRPDQADLLRHSG